MTSALMMPEKKMSTREIAELTEKQHQHVKRDCETMFAELNLDASNFGHIYLDTMNRKQTEYLLTYELVQTLITGYSIKLRHAVIQRLNELEAKQTQSPAIALPNFTDPAAAAIAWAAEYQAKQAAEAQALQLEHKVEEFGGKAKALDRLSEETEGAVCLRIAAKLMQMQEKQFLKFANAEGFIFRNHYSGTWQGYADKAKAGLVELKITKLQRDDGSEKITEQVLITRAGLAKLAVIHERRIKCKQTPQETKQPSTPLNTPPSSSQGL